MPVDTRPSCEENENLQTGTQPSGSRRRIAFGQ
jgi:hypothetical protein